jgi:hypothetical protein
MSRSRTQFSLRGALEKALSVARMDNCSFESTVLRPDYPLPKSEKEVDAFIKGRTKIWRDSWLVPPLERALEKVQRRDGEKKEE